MAQDEKTQNQEGLAVPTKNGPGADELCARSGQRGQSINYIQTTVFEQASSHNQEFTINIRVSRKFFG